jgi:hypothetical protein
VQVTILYFDGCPHWRTAEARVREAVARLGRSDVVITRQRVLTGEQSDELPFRGSPTVLVDGRDPFPAPPLPSGLSCRVWLPDAGFGGAPTVEQLMEVLDG